MSKNPFITSKILITALSACLAMVLWSGAASADTADCSIYEIAASNGTGGIDKALKPLESKLKKPPFSAWKSFKLVKNHSAKVQQMKASSIQLTDGGKLGLLYKERNDAKGRKPRLRVAMTLDDAKGKRKADMTLKVDSGDFSLVGRGASAVILAIRCSVK